MTQEKIALIVEDTESHQKLARVLLELEGFKVDVAVSGPDAITRLQATRPDVMLIDIQLPGMDGVELCRRVRRDARFASLPIIAVTAYAMTGDRERFLEQGFNGYVSKPIDQATFASTVKRFVDIES